MPSTTSRARGVDVSIFQRGVNWLNVPLDVVQFAIIKASEAETGRDSEFSNHYLGCSQTGRLRSAYHFCHPKYDPIKQARNFFDATGGRTLDFAPCLDIETELTTLTPNQHADFLIAIAAETKRLFGKAPCIYSFVSYFRDMLAHADSAKLAVLAQYPAWIADLSKGNPPSDAAHPYQPPMLDTWKFWQVSGGAPNLNGLAVSGFPGGVDQDVFNGTLADLQSWGEVPSAPSTPDPNTAYSTKPLGSSGLVGMMAKGAAIAGGAYLIGKTLRP